MQRAQRKTGAKGHDVSCPYGDVCSGGMGFEIGFEGGEGALVFGAGAADCERLNQAKEASDDEDGGAFKAGSLRDGRQLVSRRDLDVGVFANLVEDNTRIGLELVDMTLHR